MTTHAPERIQSHAHADHIRSDADAIRRLSDVPLILYAVAQGAKLAWSILCKRWPELR